MSDVESDNESVESFDESESESSVEESDLDTEELVEELDDLAIDMSEPWDEFTTQSSARKRKHSSGLDLEDATDMDSSVYLNHPAEEQKRGGAIPASVKSSAKRVRIEHSPLSVDDDEDFFTLYKAKHASSLKQAYVEASPQASQVRHNGRRTDLRDGRPVTEPQFSTSSLLSLDFSVLARDAPLMGVQPTNQDASVKTGVKNKTRVRNKTGERTKTGERIKTRERKRRLA